MGAWRSVGDRPGETRERERDEESGSVADGYILRVREARAAGGVTWSVGVGGPRLARQRAQVRNFWRAAQQGGDAGRGL